MINPYSRYIRLFDFVNRTKIKIHSSECIFNIIGELYYQVQHPIKRKKFIQISGIISLPQPKTEGEMYEL